MKLANLLRVLLLLTLGLSGCFLSKTHRNLDRLHDVLQKTELSPEGAPDGSPAQEKCSLPENEKTPELP